eukprot:2683183-Rhodomonas_salina.1
MSATDVGCAMSAADVGCAGPRRRRGRWESGGSERRRRGERGWRWRRPRGRMLCGLARGACCGLGACVESVFVWRVCGAEK